MLGVTVKLAALLPVMPPAVTLMGPVEPAFGTNVVIFVSESTVMDVAATPLNITAVAPVKPLPLMMTLLPIAPEAGVKELMVGAAHANAEARR
jgi:hypothetical protein